MKKLVLVGLLAGCLVLSASAATASKSGKEKRKDLLVQPVTSWTANYNAGLEVEYMKYNEPGLMKETGFQLGVFGEGRFQYDENIVVRAFTSLVGGNLDYDGSIQHEGDNTPYSTTTPNMIFNLRGTAGYKLTDIPYVPTPYTGLGYRYLYNDLDSDKEAGYKRHQHYFYLPLGVEGSYEMNNQWTLVPRAEFDLLLLGKNKSGDTDFTQKSGYGLRASCDFLAPEWFGLGIPIQIDIQPFIEYWSVDESDVVDNSKEPDNSTTTAGLRASVWF